MLIYMVERVLTGATLQSLEAMRLAVGEACRASTMSGRSIRSVRSTFTPGESHCRCLFEAACGDLVREVNEIAELPCRRIVLALDLDGGQVSAAPVSDKTDH
jgi:Protein of unknown function (DUF4242)